MVTPKASSAAATAFSPVRSWASTQIDAQARAAAATTRYAVVCCTSESHAEGSGNLSRPPDLQPSGVEHAAVVVAVEQVPANEAKSHGRTAQRGFVAQARI